MEHGFYLIITGFQLSVLIGIVVCMAILAISRAIFRTNNEIATRDMLHKSLTRFEHLENELSEKNKNLENCKILLKNTEIENSQLKKELEKFNEKNFQDTVIIGSIAILASKGMTQKQISEQLHISPSQISSRCQKYRIKSGGIWKREVERQLQKYEVKG